ncbi:hypothetical protein HOLleu_36006 [Holothuria leucospilota]|uniref:Uncharacterized protein n=1 Tax=Holothuria leucospilota TaxID=206669 RepID=A0A9Q1BFS2_HOLLE|nr:hypothetical protein HOLleu_36006 [Holothuria leucospilota]
MALYNTKRKSFSTKANIKNIVKVIYEENSWVQKWTLQQVYDKIRHTLNDE